MSNANLCVPRFVQKCGTMADRRTDQHLNRSGELQIPSMVAWLRGDATDAVTVDWMVLTGVIVGLGLILLGTTAGGITEAAVNATTADIQSQRAAGTDLNRVD